ncbi:MAG: hypothetical protein AAF492_10260, partial [Verrucomicrobiota bacterium]
MSGSKTNFTPRWRHENLVTHNWGSLTNIGDVTCVVTAILALKWTWEVPDVPSNGIEYLQSDKTFTSSKSHTRYLGVDSYSCSYQIYTNGHEHDSGSSDSSGCSVPAGNCSRLGTKTRVYTNLFEIWGDYQANVSAYTYDMGYSCEKTFTSTYTRDILSPQEPAAISDTVDRELFRENYAYAPVFELVSVNTNERPACNIDYFYHYTARGSTNEYVYPVEVYGDEVEATNEIVNTPYEPAGIRLNMLTSYMSVYMRDDQTHITNQAVLVSARELLNAAESGAVAAFPSAPAFFTDSGSAGGGQSTFRYSTQVDAHLNNNRLFGEVKYLKALMRWDFEQTENNVPPWPDPPAEFPDHNRDLLHDIGADLGPLGPDTGTATFQPDTEDPVIILPVATLPGWFQGLGAKAYFSESRSLPYYHDVGSPADNDGYYMAYSLNTRIEEANAVIWKVVETDDPCSGQFSTNIPFAKKRALLIRPNGLSIVFDFKWDEEEESFDERGFPMGDVNSNRTYVLYDLTPSNHTDRLFDLQYDSGVWHHFGGDSGAIQSISSVNGFAHSCSSAGGPYLGVVHTHPLDVLMSPTSAASLKFEVEVDWDEGKIAELTYITGGGEEISVKVRHNGDDFIKRIEKSFPLSSSDVDITDQTISYGNSLTLSRSTGGQFGADHGVTHTLDVPDHGVRTDEYTYNRHGLLTSHELGANDGYARTEWIYDHQAGRYSNGLWRCAKVVQQLNHYDGTDIDYQYNSTGW